MKALFSLLAILAFTGKSVHYVTGKTETNKIFYTKYSKLKWADFRPANLSDASANSSTSITYDYELTDGKIDIKVYCTFHKDLSFYRKSKATAYLLNHEQRHFDITYIYAMELVKRLKSNSCQTEEDAVRIYNEVMNEWELFQDKYDQETDNSQVEEVQKVWDNKIDELLSSL